MNRSTANEFASPKSAKILSDLNHHKQSPTIPTNPKEEKIERKKEELRHWWEEKGSWRHIAARVSEMGSRESTAVSIYRGGDGARVSFRAVQN
jgi:hypothetical protein